MEITGISDLPLHYGRVPQWLIPIMKRLSRAIVDVMLLEWGPDKVIERLSNPLWFQGFNNVIGMDWDSSGSTTVTLGILKEVINPVQDGLAVTGGKGKNSLNVPKELEALPSNFNVDAKRLSRISKLVAKTDTTLLQDGHELYHHSLLVSESGKWAIIQQGMNPTTRFARRYHWSSIKDPVNEKRAGLAGRKEKAVLNVHESVNAKRVIMDLLREDPSKIEKQYLRSMALIRGTSLDSWISLGTVGAISSEAKMVYMKPVDVRRVVKTLSEVREKSPTSLEEALLLGIGPSTMRALSLISDLIYNEPPSYQDPVNVPYDPFKYAFAIGGKDGIPFPVHKEIAFEVIHTLEEFAMKAKLEKKDKAVALNKLREMKLGVKEGT
ncbi:MULTISPECIES: DUF763 domain-containing protein [Metallosphaera]|uniref:DUF763 domain-containing protein n=3 Tax=Metallosphaera TaxID=41980 RepID=A4YGX7_METS5|nr:MULTISPECIES: DUF763 domain-containing protein [Metallosphaera]ABP95679.1 protein of unknown function DUF763 [Metallosphaera sedula DSM 5348]AIM27663.1 protein of unknown function DUF763 [Metallosphaera sedula]AKV74520.1 hypothetical protein MsedA_1545 [Metallosphaera sedula]AKV76759.1 hypothetical protein MsedB_1547 [Metallosphaera sedula]AKV79010.1 hypothetical protein MsedC_1545 [Metallosphaera sedula]